MKAKNLFFFIFTLIFALISFLPFLSVMKPIFPLVTSILFLILGVIFLFKINKSIYIILIILSIISIFYLIFPFKVEFIQKNDYYIKFFKDKTSKIVIVPIKPSLSSLSNIDKPQDYIGGSDVTSIIDPKYTILIRN